MLGEVWYAIGLIIGLMILIPLLILIVVFAFAFIKYLFDLAVQAGVEVSEWIVEKIKK